MFGTLLSMLMGGMGGASGAGGSGVMGSLLGGGTIGSEAMPMGKLQYPNSIEQNKPPYLGQDLPGVNPIQEMGLLPMSAFGGSGGYRNMPTLPSSGSRGVTGDTGMAGGPGVLPPIGEPAQDSPMTGYWNATGGLKDTLSPSANSPMTNIVPQQSNPANLSMDELNRQQDESRTAILGPVTKPQAGKQPVGSMAPPTGDPRNLMNFTGLLDNPNALVRAAGGYNMGGLLGSLGYLLTDMNPNSKGNLHQAQMTDEARRLSQQNRLSL